MSALDVPAGPLHIGFAPKLSSENFKCAFTGAEGWGSYRQHREAGSQVHEIALKHGQLRVKTLSFELAPKAHLAGTVVRVAGKTLPANASQNGARLKVTLTEPVQLQAGSMLEVRCAVSV